MNDFIDADAAKLAGLQIDLLQKLRQKKLTLKEVEAFLCMSPARRTQALSAAGSRGAKRQRLPPDHHRIVFSYYAPMPPMAQLKQELGEGCVSNIFDGRPWDLHPNCEGTDRLPGERIVWMADLPEEVELRSEAIISWAGAQQTEFAPWGYRVGTHLEGYQVWRYAPELYLAGRWAMLGSSTLYGVDRCVAVLFEGDRGRSFDAFCFDIAWFTGVGFLLVRNEKPLGV